jgi:hypothetical protein
MDLYFVTFGQGSGECVSHHPRNATYEDSTVIRCLSERFSESEIVSVGVRVLLCGPTDTISDWRVTGWADLRNSLPEKTTNAPLAPDEGSLPRD